MERLRKKLSQNCAAWGEPARPIQRPPEEPTVTAGPSSPCADPKQLTAIEIEQFDTPVAQTVHQTVDANQPAERPVLPCKLSITSKDWTLDHLLKSGSNFEPVPRISASLGSEKISARIALFEDDGIPLIIEGWKDQPRWPTGLFHPNWLKTHNTNKISVRNVYDRSDRTMSFSDFLELSRQKSTFALPNETERFYGKDAECHDIWNKWLNNSLLPRKLLPSSPDNMLLNLPKDEQVETLMCYLGVGDTFTPAHKDLCASTGQNLMCYTENNGSSFWFMTESSTAPEVSKWFHSLDQELDLEAHTLTVDQLAQAPFKFYVAEQKLGDLVLVPPRSCHQVVNHGGITIKMSWSRMSLKGLGTALHHELPIYRRVCRPETYRVKAMVYHSLLRYASDLEALRGTTSSSSSSTTTLDNVIGRLDFLLQLFDDVLEEETCDRHATLPYIESTSSERETWRGTCDFCACDIFSSFFECQNCVESDVDNSEKRPLGEGFILCPSCYVEGRTCECEDMTAVQCRSFDTLLWERNRAAKALFDARSDGRLPTARFEPLNTPTLYSEGRTPLFQAANHLAEIRRNTSKASLTCYARGRTIKHACPCASVLRCQICRIGTCFEHILETQSIHSAEALNLNTHGRDADSKLWHQRHMQKRFEINERNLLEAQKKGERWMLNDRIVLAAKTYDTCRPMVPDRALLGFYDNFIQTISPTSMQAIKVAVDRSEHENSPPTEMPLDSTSTKLDPLSKAPPPERCRDSELNKSKSPPSFKDKPAPTTKLDVERKPQPMSTDQRAPTTKSDIERKMQAFMNRRATATRSDVERKLQPLFMGEEAAPPRPDAGTTPIGPPQRESRLIAVLPAKPTLDPRKAAKVPQKTSFCTKSIPPKGPAQRGTKRPPEPIPTQGPSRNVKRATASLEPYTNDMVSLERFQASNGQTWHERMAGLPFRQSFKPSYSNSNKRSDGPMNHPAQVHNAGAPFVSWPPPNSPFAQTASMQIGYTDAPPSTSYWNNRPDTRKEFEPQPWPVPPHFQNRPEVPNGEPQSSNRERPFTTPPNHGSWGNGHDSWP